MTLEHEPKIKKALPIVAILASVVGVGFTVGLTIVIFYLVTPRGDKLAELSLTDPGAMLTVNGAMGDALLFRTDASVGHARMALLNGDELERQVTAQFRKSTLTVRAVGPSGVERTASCALYKGRSLSSSTTSAGYSCSGMLNDCVLGLDGPGPWQVRGSVAWAPELSVRSATLEVRIDAGR